MPGYGRQFERIEATLKKAAAALRDADVNYALGGSLAAWARGGPESCKDLDLMLRKQDAPVEPPPAMGANGDVAAPVKPADLKAAVMSDAAVQAMLDVFPAEIEDVEEI